MHLGPLQYGQRRDITVQMTLPPGEVPYLEATLEWNHAVSNKAIRITANGIDRNATLESVTGGVRSKMISVGIKAVNEADEGEQAVAEALIKNLEIYVDQLNEACGNPPEINALKCDISGRMKFAFNGEDRFFRWGAHYVRGLCRAH